MKAIPVIAIFDVGKTNKKLFLFDEDYNIVFERSVRFNEINDEDGFPCENLDSLEISLFDSLNEISKLKKFNLKAVNFATYGASFVYLDENGKTVAPLYNYLKPYPDNLKKQFFDTYGSEADFSLQTASPSSGSLNSGMQLYRIKYEKPELFGRIKSALHLPQYLSYLVSGQKFSDLTSIGCHTALWDFEKNDYHEWVGKEGIIDKLPPIYPADAVVPSIIPGSSYKAGIGLHDSSAAIIPYLVSFNEPFILISTGTWSISLNPFNQGALTKNEIKKDCLDYIQYNGRCVKASRLFIGYEYERQVKRIALHFKQNIVNYRNVPFEVREKKDESKGPELKSKQTIAFSQRDLSVFADDMEAYYQLMADIIEQQKISTAYVLKGTPVKRIFVDGGFSKNSVFMHLLAAAFPKLGVYSASTPQGTALGAALAIHNHWNKKPIPYDLIALNYYPSLGK